MLYILLTLIDLLWLAQGDSNSDDKTGFMAAQYKRLWDTNSPATLQECPDGSFPVLLLLRLPALKTTWGCISHTANVFYDFSVD